MVARRKSSNPNHEADVIGRSKNGRRFLEGNDGLKVSLLDYTRDPGTVASALKLATDTAVHEPIPPDDINWKEVAGGLPASRRGISYTFTVDGCSRAVTHELVRHNAHIGQESFRWQPIVDADVRIPRSITEAGPKAVLQFKTAIQQSRIAYEWLVEHEDIAYEDARYVMPMGTVTHISFTMNYEDLAKMLGQRMCFMMLPEIREVARMIKRLVEDVHPNLGSRLLIMCEKYKRPDLNKCVFPGWEKTYDCPLPWAPDAPGSATDAGFHSDKESGTTVTEKEKAKYGPELAQVADDTLERIAEYRRVMAALAEQEAQNDLQRQGA